MSYELVSHTLHS